MGEGVLYVLDALGRSMRALEEQVVAQSQRIAELEAQVREQ